MRVSLVSSPPARLFAFSASSARTHARTYARTHARVVWFVRTSHLYIGERATPTTGFHRAPNKHTSTDDNGKPIFVAFREPSRPCFQSSPPLRFRLDAFRISPRGRRLANLRGEPWRVFKLFSSRRNSGEATHTVVCAPSTIRVRIEPTSLLSCATTRVHRDTGGFAKWEEWRILFWGERKNSWLEFFFFFSSSGRFRFCLDVFHDLQSKPVVACCHGFPRCERG